MGGREWVLAPLLFEGTLLKEFSYATLVPALTAPMHLLASKRSLYRNVGLPGCDCLLNLYQWTFGVAATENNQISVESQDLILMWQYS